MKSTDVKWIYDNNYFLKAVDGYSEFSSFDGSYSSLFYRYKRNILLLQLLPEHKFLEIGCGRGEVCIYHSLNGGESIGVDYSSEAIGLAREKAKMLNISSVEFIESSFDKLNMVESCYDRILASEFIEHISREEGKLFFRKAYELLKPSGKLLVFTYPNTLQRRYGYPIIRFKAALQGKYLPKQQTDTISEHYKLYHLNEQNYYSLKALATQVGFKNVSVGYDNINNESRTLKYWIRAFINHTPLRHILLTNLYILAEK